MAAGNVLADGAVVGSASEVSGRVLVVPWFWGGGQRKARGRAKLLAWANKEVGAYHGWPLVAGLVRTTGLTRVRSPRLWFT
jgi:hypothetical protein